MLTAILNEQLFLKKKSWIQNEAVDKSSWFLYSSLDEEWQRL